MSPPSKEAQAEREWRAATDAHAVEVAREMINNAPWRMGNVLPRADRGGLVVAIQGVDGVWRDYYVRLTEAQQ